MSVKIPYLQVRNNCLIYYELPSVRPPSNRSVKIKGAYSGKITSGASKRIGKAIDILVQQTPSRYIWNPVSRSYHNFSLNFVTLTIARSKPLPASEAYKNLLKPFIRKLRVGHNLSYVWKAEFQQNTTYHGKAKKYGGQLHYHLVTDVFYPWTFIRSTWNNLQRKNGYLKEYALKYKSYDPNSTDIHSLQAVGDVAAYLRKYMDKQNTRRVNGKVWDCSGDLKRNRFSFIPSSFHVDSINRGVANGTIKQIDLDHCVIFKMKNPCDVMLPSDIVDYNLWKS